MGRLSIATGRRMQPGPTHMPRKSTSTEKPQNRTTAWPGETSVLLTVWDKFQYLLGVNREPADLNSIEMTVRTVIVYIVAIALVRIGSRRFLSQATAFDLIVAIMLGSIMSRAIN